MRQEPSSAVWILSKSSQAANLTFDTRGGWQLANRSSERSPQLPTGWFNWIKAFYKIPDTTALNHASLDGFLFLRYLKVVCVICGVGCVITWPVLFPLHILGGGGSEQLNMLTFGNVSHPNWYFVHAFLAWIYFGMI